MKVLRFLVIVAALAAPGQRLLAQQGGTDLFQRALAKERAEGQLAEAIKIYERIVKEYASDRALAAKALLQLGVCYEKLGDTGARRAYEQLVREFADQRESAASARVRLAALNKSGAAAVPRLALHRVYEGHGLDWCNGLSSDGRYLSFPDWDTGNVGLTDVRTAEVRRLTSDGAINHSPKEFTECTVFSPDDRQIAYFWQRGPAVELRAIGVDGSRRRVIYTEPQGRYLRPFDWSADATRILAVAWNKDGSSELLSIPAGGTGAPKVIKTAAARIDDGWFSPDGRSVVYSAEPPGNRASRNRDIFIAAADGSRESMLVRHPADDFPIGWSADSSRVLFCSDRTGSPGIWVIDVDGNGQPRGAAAVVKPDLGVAIPIRYVNGVFFYELNGSATDVYIASFDAAAGKLTSQPRLAKPDSSGSNSAPDWSPDGRFLAYKTIRTPSDVHSPPPLFSILNLGTGEERQLRPSFDKMDPYAEGPRWSPDGRSLLVTAHKNSSQHGVYRVDVETGATTLLIKPTRQMIVRAEWSRDGRSIVYLEGDPAHIVRRDLATGRDTELAALAGPLGSPKIALSPDGTAVAFTAKDEKSAKPVITLRIVDAGGGRPPRELYRGADGESLAWPVWAPDGRSLFFRSSTGVDTPRGPSYRQQYWRVAIDGGRPEKVNLPPPAIRISPDGRQVAYSTGDQKSELWALENLLPQPGRR
jgi:Tol biopolymer transport system component